ncbi:hypothetical protein [Streptomyces sp. SP18CS02]|uniref:hypothetical protein n=1 Tax=Streptomyces sp. SP18CS02 TaxID=3002531 RepID=UPI002E77705A|nr:hypothetical protein [Streptomyces sp. SP18CS02]MEE1752732.1 hypothetical protein [Streptomyces sp. SP18CS02]
MRNATVTALAACSCTPGRLDVFVGDAEGGVWHKTFDGEWGAWHSLDRPWTSPGTPTGHGWLTASPSGPGRIELLALGGGRDVRHRSLAVDGWTPWTSHGPLASHPAVYGYAVAATEPDDLHVLFHAGDREIAHWRLNDGRTVLRPGPYARGPLQAVSVAPGRFDLLVADARQRLILRRRFSDGWSAGWDEFALFPEDGPVPLRFAATDHGLFAAGATGLWHSTWTEPSKWEDLGGDLTAGAGGATHLAAVSEGGDAGRTDVFTVWAGTALMHRSFDRDWSEWELIDIWADPQGYHALRPQDLVALTVRGTGLRERVRPDGVVEVFAEHAGARLVVELPPQHVTETVADSGPGSQARIAGPSRLAFTLGQEVVPLTVEGVLSAMARLPLVTAPETAGQESTRLELPWRLLLGLPAGARCAHRALPAPGENGTTELWHSRIWVPEDTEPLRVRPVKSLANEPGMATPLGHHVATIAALGAQYPDRHVAVDRLILSAYGAWFSASASWPTLDWTHRTAMGRDYYVRVLTRGALFPFGHRAAYVEMTERRFEQSPSVVAALRKRRVLIVTEPTRRYGIGQGGAHERAFPFQEVSVEPQQLTELDEPTWLPSKAFWPTRSAATVQFTVRARADREVVDFRLPMLFVPDTATGTSNASALDTEYARGPRTGTQRDSGRPTGDVGRRIALAMESAARPLDGAVQEVRSMTFGGAGTAPAANGVGFHPRVTRMEVALPAVRQLLGSTPTVPVEFSNAFLQTAAGARPPDVMLALLQPKVLDFAAAGARTGMVAAPNMAVTEIARKAGPVAGGPFPPRPQDLFTEDAKLFGVIPLRRIVSVITSRPEITWSDVVGAPSAKLTWREKLSTAVEPFHPKVPRSSVFLEVVSNSTGNRPGLRTTGEVTDFTLEIPTRSAALVVLTFNNVRFTAHSGERPGLTFDLADARLAGKLNFVRTLAEKIPQAGRGGPRIEISAVRIRATYAIAVPTLGMGVFSVQNLAIHIGLTLSLENRPIEIDFAFATRERPFLVTVSGFGGGGYLELGVSAGEPDGGLQRFVGGIEFGAGVAMDFGVAAGEVHVFGGVVFVKTGGDIEITGYLRIGGSVSVLGLIRVSVELTLSLTYSVERNELHGTARLVISVDLTFWSTSVTLECRKSFPGPGLTLASEQDLPEAPVAPRASSVETALGPQGRSFPWQTYCQAFA